MVTPPGLPSDTEGPAGFLAVMIQTVPDTGMKKSNESRERERETEKGRMGFYLSLTPSSARRRLSEVAAAVWSSCAPDAPHWPAVVPPLVHLPSGSLRFPPFSSAPLCCAPRPAEGHLPHQVNFTGPSGAGQAQHRGLSGPGAGDGEVAQGGWRLGHGARGGRRGAQEAGKGGWRDVWWGDLARRWGGGWQ